MADCTTSAARERDLDFVAPMDVNIDFGLDDRGEIVLKETGEETEEIIAKECYPELEAVFCCTWYRSSPPISV